MWRGSKLPLHYHPYNAPEPPRSGVSGSAALESKGFRRAGRTCTSCIGATAFQFLLELQAIPVAKTAKKRFCKAKSAAWSPYMPPTTIIMREGCDPLALSWGFSTVWRTRRTCAGFIFDYTVFSAAGRQTVMRVPRPSRESTSKWPPWRSTIQRAMARPRPVPPLWRARAGSER